MKRLLLLAVAAAATACGGNLADEVRDALPSKDAVQIGTPSGGAASALAVGGGSTASSVGTPSLYEAATAVLAFTVNLGVAAWLDVLRAVVLQPPTSCGGDSCTWGPGSHPLDRNDWKLIVTRVQSGGLHYDYALSGQPKSPGGTGFIEVITGTVYPSGQPRHGHGTFLVDFDSAASLGVTQDTGTLEVAHDNVGSVKVDCTFLGAKDPGHPGEKQNAAYAYAQDGTGGDLQVATHRLATGEVFALHSRWNPTGAGRGDASYASPSPVYSATASECWGAASDVPPFDVVYWHASDPNLGADSGVESACAFIPAAPPTIQAP